MSQIVAPSMPSSPVYIGKGLQGQGGSVEIFGYPLPNNLSNEIQTLLGDDAPWYVTNQTTLFDVSSLTEDHEFATLLYDNNIYQGTSIDFRIYRSRDNIMVLRTYWEQIPLNKACMAFWWGWLSQGTEGRYTSASSSSGMNMGSYTLYGPFNIGEGEIVENGYYYITVLGYTVNFAVKGIPAFTRVFNPTTTTVNWKIGLSETFDTNSYIRVGICTQNFTNGQSSPPSGIIDYINAPSNNDACIAIKTVTGLTPKKSYTFYGFAQSNNGLYYTSGSSYIRTEPISQLATPTLVSLSVTGTSVMYTVSEILNADGYYSIKFPLVFPDVSRDQVLPTFVWTDLTPNTEYHFTVWAYAETTYEDSVVLDIIVTTIDAPAIPTAPSASRGEGSLYVSWPAVSGVTYYNLFYSWDSGSYFGKVDVYATSYTLSNLFYGKTYTLKIWSANDYGHSDYSSESIITTAPQTPTISIGTITNNTINIITGSISGNYDKIRIYRQDTGTYLDCSANNYVTFTGLTAGITYSFYAKSYFYINSTTLWSVNNSPTISANISNRPEKFYWDTSKFSGKNCTDLKATEWNRLIQNIRDMYEYKGIPSYTPIMYDVTAGSNFDAVNDFNKIKNAIGYFYNNTDPVSGVGISDKNSGDTVYASYFDGDYSIVKKINDIT